uniref:Oxidoreductase ykwC n=1 Tax=Triticum urartu TaxID=4572 RepID=A0A8R7P701_TRIUA
MQRRQQKKSSFGLLGIGSEGGLEEEEVMAMEEATATAFGFPAEVRPGATRVGWIGIGVMGGAMAARLLAAGFAMTAYARTPAKAGALVAAGARLADSPASVAAASDVVFTMVGNPGDVRSVVLDAASGALAGLRPGGVLVDCTSSSPSLAREVAAAARAAGCHAVDCPVSGGDVGARDGTLALLAGGDEAVVAWLAPLFAHLGRPTYMGPPGSGQSSKIANQIAVAGAVVGLGESLAFAGAAGLDERLFLGAVSKGAAGSRVMDIFGERALSRDFSSGGSVRYIIKDLGMALEVGDGQEEEEANVLPGSALYRQMFSAMAANGDGELCLQGLITVVERLNGIMRK